MRQFKDHPLRYSLANEMHARPFPVISAPCRVVFLAIKQPSEAASRDRALDFAHLAAILDLHGAPHPKPGATHHSAQIGKHVLKWEQHTEFVSYSVFLEGEGSRPFDANDFDVFPSDWLDQAPGERIASISLRVGLEARDETISSRLADWFVPESLAVSRVLDDAATVASDFRIDSDGNMRFAVFVSPDMGQRRIGRVVQRLCEIETYKAMSMLGFARVRQLSDQISVLDDRLTRLTIDMSDGAVAAENSLGQLLSISAELESAAARTSFRFGATGAYEALVHQKIASLREQRFLARQTIGEIMTRRYQPAMRTVKATEQRLRALADRAKRTGDLLRTRVDVERSAQNQALLESMDRRADLQLRLQRTVEGLSVVAISYYAVNLVTYGLYPLAKAGGIDKTMLTAGATPVIVLLVWLVVHRIRNRH